MKGTGCCRTEMRNASMTLLGILRNIGIRNTDGRKEGSWCGRTGTRLPTTEKEDESGDDPEKGADLSVRTMFLMAVATSIDALAVGITFAFLNVSIIPAASLIGVTTFIIAAVGIYIGNVFGAKYKSKAELAGGIILVLIGVKILLEHLGIVNF